MSAPNYTKELENGNNQQHMSTNLDDQLRQVMSNTLSISPEIFEKIYLAPKNKVKGDLRRTFANPTPLGVMGFSVGLFPVSIQYMQWRGSGGFAVATTSVTLWFGGLLLLVAGILEFILGNTFPFVVFMGYACHFLTVATTFMPQFGAVSFYAPPGTPAGPDQITPQWAAGFGFYMLAQCILSSIFLICSLRTNGVYAVIFLTAATGFGCASGSFWATAAGNMSLGNTLLVSTGAFFFASAMLGWYLFLSLMLIEVDFPGPNVPVFDLSTIIKGKSSAKKEE